MVAAKPKKSSLTWNDVKGKVADFDRAGLVGLLQALIGCAIAREDEFPAAAPADRNRHARRPAVAFCGGV